MPGMAVVAPCEFSLDTCAACHVNAGMKTDGQPRDLFTASEVALFCAVDLKTIHNWADHAEIRHFRTPGRHLRFRRVDVIEFLRKFGYPVPDALTADNPHILVVDDDAASLGSVRRTLSKRFDVSTYRDPLEALVAIGSDAPDGVVLDLAWPDFDALHFLARLKHLPATRHIRTVVFSAAEAKKKALNAGASAFVAKPDASELNRVLEALMGDASA